MRKKSKHCAPDNGCAYCVHYSGAIPANVPNFACSVGGTGFKIYFCDKFLRKRGNDNGNRTELLRDNTRRCTV